MALGKMTGWAKWYWVNCHVTVWYNLRLEFPLMGTVGFSCKQYFAVASPIMGHMA